MRVKLEDATYLLPLRARTAAEADEIAAYLRALPASQIIVVDGSADDVFRAYDSALSGIAYHVAPDPQVRGKNGKVRGVLTGLALAKHEKIVIADDDVRYDAAALRRVLRLLDAAHVVRPQNYFDPLPWHALIDTSRTLINRALDGDWPGTLGLRKSALPGGYNADVLFENYELVRTVRARGGSEIVARDVFVRRRPPTASHFWSQRVRQAYDEFARPARLAAALAILPIIAAAAAAKTWTYPLALCASAVLLAAVGWLRAHGYRHFPLLAVPLAPIWVAERAVCAWLALYERARFGGVRYGDQVISAAASPRKEPVYR